MIDENLGLDGIRELFSHDRFAKYAGCSIVEAGKGHAICKMPLSDMHLNAQGGIMGGAIFTLADFALAVAVNVGQPATVAIDNNIRFLSAPKGSELYARATSDKTGKSLGFVTVTVTDDEDTTVAIMTATGFRTEQV